jgi:Dehydrogenase E1 component
MYCTEVVIRETELRVSDFFLENLAKGASHASLGQEAVAVGFADAMQPGDLSFCTYRGQAHTLARGVAVTKVLGELMQTRYRIDARQRRPDASDVGRSRWHGLLCDHRRAAADRLRRRLARTIQGPKGRYFGLSWPWSPS